MLDLFCKLSLAVSELTPIVPFSKTGKLHEMERHFLIAPIASPVLNKETEELLVHRDIEIIRLALIPDHALYRELLQRLDSCVEKTSRSERMSCRCIFRISEIDLTHLDAPLIDHRVAEPVLKDLRILCFKSFS